ncbi:MAG TPA: hypothetical protein VMD99_02640 [Terriglobales bacterium]|nr:hypothetical protein [Terriglobales bacterium]
MDVKLNVDVPHVWYDLIGRVIPGAFLIVGLGAECLRDTFADYAWEHAAIFGR